MTSKTDLTTQAADRRRAAICASTLGLAIAANSAASLSTVGLRTIEPLTQSPYAWAIIPAVSIAIGAIVSLVCYLVLKNLESIVTWADNTGRKAADAITFNRKGILTASAIIFACWIPWIIIEYPCSMNGDTYNQLYQFQTSAPTLYTTMGVTVEESFVDHHPVFDTLLFGAFLTLGDVIGSQNLGLFAYSIFQCALTALGMGLTCCYLERLSVPRVFRIASLVFFALFPPIPLWATCMIKDSINACMFIFFSLVVVEIVRTRGEAFGSKRMVAAYILIAILCILTKKSGAVVVALASLTLAIFFRSRWREATLGLIVPALVCFALVPAVVYPAIGGVAPGGKQEAFGFALQQVITAMNENDDLNEWERERVEAVLNVDRALEKYRPDLVDPVKNSANKNASTQDYLAFVPAYLSIGMRHPIAYLDSTFNVAGTLVTPGRTFTFNYTPVQEDSWVAGFENADTKGELHLTFDKPEPLASISAAVNSGWRIFVPMLGPLQLFCDNGFYGGWIPLTCLVLCLFYDRRWTVALVPALAVVLILLLGPASSVRYDLPLVYTTPLMLGIACASLRSKRNTSANGKSG